MNQTAPNPKPMRHGVAVILHRSGNVAVSVRNNMDKTFYGCLQFPGGSVERGESPLAAAVREVYEETGLTIDPDRFQSLGSDTRRFTQRPGAHGTPSPDFIGHCFAVALEDHEVLGDLEPDRQSQWAFISRDAAVILGAAFIPGLAQYLPVF